jgi:hypothetical protein
LKSFENQLCGSELESDIVAVQVAVVVDYVTTTRTTRTRKLSWQRPERDEDVVQWIGLQSERGEWWQVSKEYYDAAVVVVASKIS